MNPQTTKRYHLAGENFEMTVEIDHALMAEDKLHEINRFWTSADLRLAAHDGSVLKAVLELLFCRVQRVVVEDPFGLNVQGVINAFAWVDHSGNRKSGEEGWPDMDGQYGIRIVDVSDVTLDEEPSISEFRRVER